MKINIKIKGKNRLFVHIIFVFFLIGLFFFLGLHKVFFAMPGGIHFMRQTDSLSFVSQYFNKGFNFFNPQLFNLKNIDGRAACEFPIIYYLTALLYVVVGQKIFLLKLMHIIIAYTGVYYVFKLSYLLLKDYFYAFLVGVFLFTSTVFNYYSFNYLPDIAALGFSFIAWYLVFKYQENLKNRTLFTAVLFFSLASLIKVTYAINPIAAILYYLYLYFSEGKSIKHQIRNIMLYFIVGFGLVLLWNGYMLYYNKLYGGLSFNTKALPIWGLSADSIHSVWNHIVNDVYVDYFAPFLYYLISVLILFQAFFYKKMNKELLVLTLILFFGIAAYFILFYAQFKDHDYYFLAFAPLVIFILINSLIVLKKTPKKKHWDIIIKITLLILFVAGINDSKARLAYRHWAVVDDYSKTGLTIRDNIEEINKLKITADAKFIVAPDLCQNGGLFFLNRAGWNITEEENILTNQIKQYKKMGADYLLLVSKNEEVLKIGAENGNLIYKNMDIRIYKLQADE